MKILIIMGMLLCIGYYLLIISYAGITADFAWIWLAAAIGMGFLLLIWKNKNTLLLIIPKTGRFVILLLVIAGMMIFFGYLLQILKGMESKAERNLDYVVVLGAQVRGEKPSKALVRRLKEAMRYAKENPETILILSGGQGPGEDISEAECMRRYMVSHKIDEERLILEDRSVNTKQNLEYSHRMTGCADKHTGILSNDFHVYRALALAKKMGYKNAEGIAAESDMIMQMHYVVREVFALIKEKVKGNI